MFRVGGITVFKNPSLVIQRDEIVKRTWKERLFSLPWRPWIDIRLVIHYDPDPHVYVYGNRLIAHPDIIAKLINQLDIKEITNGYLSEVQRELVRVGNSTLLRLP
jgi:hypothetical protein